MPEPYLASDVAFDVRYEADFMAIGEYLQTLFWGFNQE
jgi:hypothetical protein